MIRSSRLAVVLAAAAGMGAAVWGAATDAGASTAPATLPAVTGKMPAPAFAAMTYYDQSCSNCHGPQGSFYGPTLGNDLTDAGLVKEVRDMAKGPSNAPLSDTENDVETAFHRALIMHNPYVSVTEIKDGKWSGEVMPDSKLTLVIGNKKIEPTLDGWNWTAELPAGTKPADVVIEAELNGKKTLLKPAEATYSNTTPLPPKDQRHR